MLNLQRFSAQLPAWLLLLACTPGLAEWGGGVEGGTVLQDGESATRLRLKLSNDSTPLSHYLYADWINSGSGGNAYEVGYKPRYWFTEQLYGFWDGSAGQDKPLSIEKELQMVAGVGYRQKTSDTSMFFAEAGLGQQNIEFINESESEQSFGLVRGGFTQILSDLLKLEFDGQYQSAEKNVQTQAEAGLSLRVAGGAVKVSYRVRTFEADGAESISSDDTAVSFTYGF